MRLLKKSVSIILSIVLIFSIFAVVPFEFSAETVVTTWGELAGAVSNGRSAVLGADITGGASDSFLNIAGGKTISIDLNGFTLSRGEISDAKTGYVFKISSGAMLTVTDSGEGSRGRITGGSSENGGAFYNEGTLNIESGSVVNNSASKSGGAVYNKGSFNMSGGVLSGNVSPEGGAVYNDAQGIMTLSGTAVLIENKSDSYGGGALSNYGRLSMTGSVEIARNTAFTQGGAIWTGGGVLNLYGGTITDNTAGIAGNGIYYKNGTLNMQGSPVVRFNDDDDLFLCEGKKINVTGQLVPTAALPGEYPNVGIVTAGSDRLITSGLTQNNPGFSTDNQFFFTRDYHALEMRDGELYSESFKTTYVYRYWDSDAKKVRSDYMYHDNVIDAASLTDDVSVGMHSGNWYIVRGNVKIIHRLNIVGKANLILGDGATLTCSDGIRCERRLNSVLNIYAQSEGTGKLIADSDARDWATSRSQCRQALLSCLPE